MRPSFSKISKKMVLSKSKAEAVKHFLLETCWVKLGKIDGIN